MKVQIQTADDEFENPSRQHRSFIHESKTHNYYHFSKSVSWTPALNIYEDKNNYYLCVELAGLDKKQIAVDVVEDKIIIRGDRPVPLYPEAAETGCILRLEIDSGAFERDIKLPENADMDNVQANFVKGYLWVAVGKK